MKGKKNFKKTFIYLHSRMTMEIFHNLVIYITKVYFDILQFLLEIPYKFLENL